MQNLALIEYGKNMDIMDIDRNVILTDKGFEAIGNGIRIDLDNYNDLVC